MHACPFCSGDSRPAVIELDEGLWVVICRNCNAFGPHPHTDQDRTAAIQRWNAGSGRRAPRIKTDLDFLLMVAAALASLALVGLAIYLS